jgi:hypothetical protein
MCVLRVNQWSTVVGVVIVAGLLHGMGCFLRQGKLVTTATPEKGGQWAGYLVLHWFGLLATAS